jgi:hypothetical protein
VKPQQGPFCPDLKHQFAKANQRLVEMEEKYDLLHFQIDGWCVWPLLRFSVGSLLYGFEYSHSTARYSYFDLASAAAVDLYKILTASSREVVVRAYDSNRSEKRGEKFIDIFFDDLLVHTGSYFKIEILSNPIFSEARKAALVKADMTSTLFGFIAKLLSKTISSQEIHKISREISIVLSKKEGLENFKQEYIYTVINNFIWSYRLYRWLFRKIRPRYLLIVNPYGDHAVVAAARSMDVEVIEFQHGYIVPWHVGYSWPKYARNYKKHMPIPDKIFLYGEYWRQFLITDGFWDESELIVVGSLRMDYHRQTNLSRPKGTVRLLWTTQPIAVDKSIDFMVKFLEEYTGTTPLEIYIKLHPGETSKAKYEDAFKSFKFVKVLNSTEMPSVFDILRSSHIHVSLSSTCHFEALALGIPTVVLPVEGHEHVTPLKEFSGAFLAENPRDLVEIINNLENITISSSTSHLLFANDSLNNIKKEIGL